MLAGAVLFGALCELKILHAVVGIPVLPWAAWRQRHAIAWRWSPSALGLCAIVGGSSYAHAWLVTGNPVLPLMNSWFRSPYFPLQDFGDARWHAGLDADVLWDISFDTEHYLESFDGGFGFVLIALLGVWLLALRDVRTRGLASVASVSLAAAAAAHAVRRVTCNHRSPCCCLRWWSPIPRCNAVQPPSGRSAC